MYTVEEIKNKVKTGTWTKEDVARYADKEANPLYPVPILWDDKQLALMYHLVQEKKEKENNSHAETGHRDYTGISA